MGIQRKEYPVPMEEVRQEKVPYNNLAAAVGHKDGENLNYTFERRQDANGENIYAKKREGFASLSAMGSADTKVGRGIYSWRRSASTVDELFAALDNATNTRLYKDVSGTLTVQQITGSDILLTTGKTVRFVPVFAYDGSTTTEQLYVFTGFDDMRKYNGSAWAVSTAGAPLSGSSDRAMYAVFHNNILFAAGTANNPNRLFMSDVGKPETFTAGNAIDFPGEITGLVSFAQFVVVFTRDSISLVWGFEPTQIQVSHQNRGVVPKYSKVGCDAPMSIAQVGDWLYFWNKDRFYRFNTAEIQEVAYPKLQGTIATIVKTASSCFAASSFRDRYYCAIVYSTGSVNNRIAVYDPSVDEWVLHSAPPVHSLALYRASADAAPDLLFVTNDGTSRTQKVYKYNAVSTPIDTLDGSTTASITFQYTSEHLEHGDRHLLKKAKYLFWTTKGLGSTATMDIQVSSDYGEYENIMEHTMTSGGFILDQSHLDRDALGGGTLSKETVRKLRTPASRTVSVRFKDTQAIAQTELYSFDFLLSPKKLKTT
jgi:hypothetical protein